eukprot:7207255-Prymnesium_polylepis.1
MAAVRPRACYGTSRMRPEPGVWAPVPRFGHAVARLQHDVAPVVLEPEEAAALELILEAEHAFAARQEVAANRWRCAAQCAAGRRKRTRGRAEWHGAQAARAGRAAPQHGTANIQKQTRKLMRAGYGEGVRVRASGSGGS